jgi:DNA-binding NarL/FixJ family response regulator
VTIKLHVRGICRKLDANNRTQAALRGQALGFVKMN